MSAPCRTVQSQARAVPCQPDNGTSLNVSTGTTLQPSSCALVTVFTHAQLYCPICECEVMVLCTGVDDAVNQAPQCISTLKALSTRLLLRCFFVAANWLLPAVINQFLQDPNVIYNIADFDEIASALLVGFSQVALLVGRSQSLFETTHIIADFIQKIAASLLVACSQKHIRHYAFCSRMAAQSSAEHRALVIAAIPSLRA